MRQPSTRERGRDWEHAAEARLAASGLRTIARNVGYRGGEIDLIMDDAGTVVFVEVRYRAAGSRLAAIDSIGPAKRQRLLRAASLFLASQPQWAGRPARFDLVCIDGPADAPNWTWLRDAFQA